MEAIAAGSRRLGESLGPDNVDFLDVTLDRTGDIITINVDYEINQILNLGGVPITLDIVGTLVANGPVQVPEPGATLILFGSSIALLTRRRR